MSKINEWVPLQTATEPLDAWVSMKTARVSPRLGDQVRMYIQRVKDIRDAREEFERFVWDKKVFAKVEQELQDFLYKNGVHAKITMGFIEDPKPKVQVLMTEIDGGADKAAKLGQTFLDVKPTKVDPQRVRWDMAL